MVRVLLACEAQRDMGDMPALTQRTMRAHNLFFGWALMAAACSSSNGTPATNPTAGTTAAPTTASGSGATTAPGTTVPKAGTGTTTGTAGTLAASSGTAAPAIAGTPAATGGTVAPATAGTSANPPPATGGTANVLQFHKNASRDGHYVDAAFTRAAAAKIHKDAGFMATMSGPTYAQPLFFEGGPGGKDIVIVATETNEVSAFDAMTGAMVWRTMVAPAGPKGGGAGGCSLANITPVGVTGTPVIDAASRTLFLAAMTTNGKHEIHALSLDDGKAKPGWPVDVSAVKAGSTAFNSPAENQRGALLILNGILYVPYGGHFGDCGDYRGWVVGVPIDNPKAPLAWATRGSAGGVWAPSGIASDGTSVFVATGNTMAAPSGAFPMFSSPSSWSDGEAIIRLPPDLTFTGKETKDFFAAENWAALDDMDLDIGGSGVVLFNVPGATPSKLAIALGKDGSAYLASQENLGGMGGQLGKPVSVGMGNIMQAAVAYTTPTGTFVTMRAPGTMCTGGGGRGLTSIKITAASPPAIEGSWCAAISSSGSPIVTSTDGSKDSVVWIVAGTKLLGFDGETGAPVFNGGAAGDAVGSANPWQTPIVAKGRLYFASSNQLQAFSL